MTIPNHMKKLLKRIAKDNPSPYWKLGITGVHAVINSRHELRQQLDAAEQGGRVCFFAGGSDCDHVYSHHASVMDRPTLLKADRMIDREYHDAEGPTFARFIRPDEAPEDDGFRDYIAEAHEDGHPHLVHG